MSNKKSLLFVMQNAESHLVPTFQLAKIIESKGNTIFYVALPRHRTLLESQGFNSIDLLGFPFGLGFEKDNREFEKSTDLYLDVLLDKISNRIYEDRRAKLTKIVEDLQPALILIDMWVSTDFIILYPLLQKYPIKVAFINPMLLVLSIAPAYFINIIA